ncbi:MAG: carboxypeptidase regulatory-like domain-containing protein [Planctomycetota bacterium]
MSPRLFHNNHSAIRSLVCIAGCFLIGLAGCSDQLKTYPVKGKVQFEGGNPVVVGMVELQSIEHKINARGDINRDGTFTLTTFAEGDGAIAGKHKCVVLQMVMTEHLKGHRHSNIGVVDRRHASYATSGLEVEISADEPNDSLVIEVQGVLEEQPPEDKPHTH